MFIARYKNFFKRSPYSYHMNIKKIWNFFWKEDSVASWVANLIVAFLIIRYIVYPVLGIVLGTSFPIVAVVSESMEHGLHNNDICGQNFNDLHESFDNYWDICGSWYENKGISKQQFSEFPLKNGFDKGDVIILWRANVNNLEVGDTLVFRSNKPQPIIHRIVKIFNEDENKYFQTKGDHNGDSISGDLGETRISKDRLLGKAVLRIPYLGWMKILFVEAVKPLGWVIER
jgi:signal peptidase I